MPQLTVLICLLLIQSLISGVVSTSFSVVNKCEFTVWPGIFTTDGVPAMSPTGFALQKDEARTIDAPSSWGGRIWGRTFCSTNSAGNFSCATGDCGSGKIECSGTGAMPATLAEFKLSGSGSDFYDVAVVNGYNLPILVEPHGAGQKCSATGCVVDLNSTCPSELMVEERGMQMACRNACDAFRQPLFCCTGAYSTPDKCKPTLYSRVFKTACPRAYSYTFDEATSTFSCGGSPNYTITFCPSANSSRQISYRVSGNPPAVPLVAPTAAPPAKPPSTDDSTMIYKGTVYISSASLPTCLHPARSYAFGVFVMAFCWFLRLGAFSGFLAAK